MKEQKAYHTRKLAIIEMIEEVETRIISEQGFIERFSKHGIKSVIDNSNKNISKWNRIKEYLTERYNRQQRVKPTDK